MSKCSNHQAGLEMGLGRNCFEGVRGTACLSVVPGAYDALEPPPVSGSFSHGGVLSSRRPDNSPASASPRQGAGPLGSRQGVTLCEQQAPGPSLEDVTIPGSTPQRKGQDSRQKLAKPLQSQQPFPGNCITKAVPWAPGAACARSLSPERRRAGRERKRSSASLRCEEPLGKMGFADLAPTPPLVLPATPLEARNISQFLSG